MKANEVLEKLGERGLYVVQHWVDSTSNCAVEAYPEAPEGEVRPDPTDLVAVAVGSGPSYEDALNDLHTAVVSR